MNHFAVDLDPKIVIYSLKTSILRCTWDLGPLHHSDGLVKEVLAFDTNKTYVMAGLIASWMAIKEVGKGAAISTFEKKDETKSRLPDSF